MNETTSLTSEERAVIEAARRCFGSVEVDGKKYRPRAVCLWNTSALAGALDRLDDAALRAALDEVTP